VTDLRTLLASRNAKIAAAGAAVLATVGVARLRRRSENSTSSPAAAINPTRPTYQGSAVYDSTSSDLYNSLMPQLETFERQLADVQRQLDTTSTTNVVRFVYPPPAPPRTTSTGGRILASPSPYSWILPAALTPPPPSTSPSPAGTLR
jgi:hypothetical protein